MKSSRWMMVMVGVIAFLMVGTAVWASPPSTGPSVPPLATPGLDADKVDGHHAVVSNAPRSQRKNKLLWALSNGKFSSKALPMTQLDNRFLNDDRKEMIEAAVTGGALLTVYNTGSGGDVYGLLALGEDYGVRGQSGTGTGVLATSHSGVPLMVEGYGTNLIEAWDTDPTPDERRFRVTTSGDVYAHRTFHSWGADFAEMMATVEGVTYEPGDLLVIGPDGKPLPSSAPNATNLLGVYSSEPGFVGGVGVDGETTGKIPVGIMGIVSVKASTENGTILPGDLLTSSSMPGHAMKASPVTIDGTSFYLPGTILGKALEPLEEGRAVILVLVTLQ